MSVKTKTPKHLTISLPKTLDNLDDNVKEFWNEESDKLHSKIWHPHQTISDNKSSNYQAKTGEYWKEVVRPTYNSNSSLSINIPDNLLSFLKEDSVSLKKDGTPVKQSARTLSNKEKHKDTISKKIRIYPEDESLWINSLNQYRRAYNISIEMFKKGRKPSTEMRRRISRMIKHEGARNGWIDNVNLVQEAFREAKTVRTAIIRMRMAGSKCDYRFKSRMEPCQTFVVSRISPKKSIYPRVLGSCFYTESVPDVAVGQNAKVTYENNQWHVSVKDTYKAKDIKANDLSVIALDPGKRTFMTGFSADESVKYGDKFVEDKLLPLMLKVDKLLSKRDHLKKHKSEAFKLQRLKGVNNRIKKLRARQDNLVKDLHRRVAFDLVMNNDVILLPTFETQKMVKRSEKRKSNKQVARTLLGLAHYKFKQTLKWMAKKYGKVVIDVNESYTSKTLWDGSIKTNLGGKHQFRFDGKIVDRDVHGARNILIRFLTKVNNAKNGVKEKVIDVLSPNATYALNIIETADPYRNIRCLGGFGVFK